MQGPLTECHGLRLQRLSLNGTVESRDLVNVTITIPPIWAHELFNATVTGKGYLNVRSSVLTSHPFYIKLRAHVLTGGKHSIAVILLYLVTWC